MVDISYDDMMEQQQIISLELPEFEYQKDIYEQMEKDGASTGELKVQLNVIQRLIHNQTEAMKKLDELLTLYCLDYVKNNPEYDLRKMLLFVFNTDWSYFEIIRTLYYGDIRDYDLKTSEVKDND